MSDPVANTATTAPAEVLPGERVLRVSWLPGSDRLRGSCHCGAESEADDPIAMWEWLLAHPDHPAAGPEAPPEPIGPPPAHTVSRRIMIGARTPLPPTASTLAAGPRSAAETKERRAQHT
ncbi:hypothetical protein GB931_13095 [Modestobacter sp. I12A-02628]|uniref:Uncharacterized protein n=1 Tax=Goekera deserti TaxID=2497753 RepID=A0A7K3W9W3_9ACTN|nr:hypothetical protein [Goekera deserti]MPQ98838.1 hypothetical protein [Goekera deserti]NDI49663.1 hypothetical protein [Goekera deserti]NEL53144.1 hypothetical protein [Goekera deserti]